MCFKEGWSTGTRDVKAQLSGSVWLPPVSYTGQFTQKQKLSSSITPAAFLAFIHVAIPNGTDIKWFYSQKVLNRTIEAMTEQLRIAGNRED